MLHPVWRRQRYENSKTSNIRQKIIIENTSSICYDIVSRVIFWIKERELCVPIAHTSLLYNAFASFFPPTTLDSPWKKLLSGTRVNNFGSTELNSIQNHFIIVYGIFDSNLENVNIPDFASQVILFNCKTMELSSNDHDKNHYHDDHS